MRIIAFTGPKASGKDTAAKYLLARNSLFKMNLFVQTNFADVMKQSCALVFGLTESEVNDPALKEVVLDRWPFETPRTLMQNYANLMRSMYSPDIWVKAWERRIRIIKTECLIVTDLRFPNELEALQALDAKIIYVQNREVEKKMAEGVAANEPLWMDASEAHYTLLKGAAHAVISNDSSIDDLHSQVQLNAQQLLGDWGNWAGGVDTLGVKL